MIKFFIVFLVLVFFGGYYYLTVNEENLSQLQSLTADVSKRLSDQYAKFVNAKKSNDSNRQVTNVNSAKANSNSKVKSVVSGVPQTCENITAMINMRPRKRKKDMTKMWRLSYWINEADAEIVSSPKAAYNDSSSVQKLK